MSQLISKSIFFRDLHKGAFLHGRLLCLLTILFFPLLLLLSPSKTAAASINDLVHNGCYAVELDGKIIISHNLHTAFIPASTLKVLTALTALETLGPDYRWKTKFFIDAKNNLYIRGGGDPLLTSERIADIAKQIKRLQIRSFNSIVLDDSAFSVAGPPPGSETSDNPYDVENGALCVNFNALPFSISPSGKVTSAEVQTPPLPMMRDFARGLAAGSYRVNVSSRPQIQPLSNVLRYSGELFTALLQKEGIIIKDGIKKGTVPARAVPLLEYSSETTLQEVVQQILYYSNNYMANQLFLLVGMQRYGAPATWQKGRRAAYAFAQEHLGLTEHDLTLVDGSGLSKDNRITAATMLKILDAFTPHAALLKKRRGNFVKSGTLTGVYCYTGYLQLDNRQAPFVLLLNQQQNTRDSLLQRLYQLAQKKQAASP